MCWLPGPAYGWWAGLGVSHALHRSPPGNGCGGVAPKHPSQRVCVLQVTSRPQRPRPAPSHTHTRWPSRPSLWPLLLKLGSPGASCQSSRCPSQGRAVSSRHRRVQHPLCGRGGDGRLHHLPHPQPVPAEHVAVPGAAGRHAGPERRADPRSGFRGRQDPRGDLGHHRIRCAPPPSRPVCGSPVAEAGARLCGRVPPPQMVPRWGSAGGQV